MLVDKAIKVRLYPTHEQQIMLNQHFGACRFTYNKALDKKISTYRIDQTKLSKNDLIKWTTVLRNDPEFPWLLEIKAEVIQNQIDNLDNAFTKFFKGGGFPKFKSKHSAKQSFKQKQNFRILRETNKIVFLKKKIKFKCSDQDAEEIRSSDITSITYSKDNTGKYFASVGIEWEMKQKENTSTKEIGIDLGLNNYIMTSDGESVNPLKFLKKSEKKLAKAQKKFARTKKGSNNRETQRIKVAKIYKKIIYQRDHFIHNLSHKLVSENQSIHLENLSIKGMVKDSNDHAFNRAVADASWNKLVSQLKYKGLWYGCKVHQISRWDPSSKCCNKCHNIKQDLKRSDKIYVCHECGHIEDRDLNAAKNILDMSHLRINRDELARINASGDPGLLGSEKEERNSLNVETEVSS